MKSVMDSSQPNATPYDLVASLRRTEDIVVVPLIPRVRRFTTKPQKRKEESDSQETTPVLKKKRQLPAVLWKFVNEDARKRHRKKILSFDDMLKEAKVNK